GTQVPENQKWAPAPSGGGVTRRETSALWFSVALRLTKSEQKTESVAGLKDLWKTNCCPDLCQFAIGAPEADICGDPNCDLDPEQHRGFSRHPPTPANEGMRKNDAP